MRKGTLTSFDFRSFRHAQALSRAIDVALCLKLPVVPYIVCVNRACSGETVRMFRPV